jgi:hypothetical protein
VTALRAITGIVAAAAAELAVRRMRLVGVIHRGASLLTLCSTPTEQPDQYPGSGFLRHYLFAFWRWHEARFFLLALAGTVLGLEVYLRGPAAIGSRAIAEDRSTGREGAQRPRRLPLPAEALARGHMDR